MNRCKIFFVFFVSFVFQLTSPCRDRIEGINIYRV